MKKEKREKGEGGHGMMAKKGRGGKRRKTRVEVKNCSSYAGDEHEMVRWNPMLMSSHVSPGDTCIALHTLLS